ncbi:MAG: hypothetical protein ACI9W6_002322 [Motiliproteus sp.]|jgi:hypothetical protein
MHLTLTDLVCFLVVAVVTYLWWHGRGLKDSALGVVKRYCDEQQLQLLDEGLVLSKVRILRSDAGILCLRRQYRFEFSSTGDERYCGTIDVLGKRIQSIKLDPHRMPL